jgi:hypothetical protein
VAVVLYLRLFRLPFVPIDPAGGDQAMFLWGATKVLNGQVIYRDFFQFTTPGTEYFYALLIKLFGQTASMPKLVEWAVAVAFAAVGVRISRYLLSGWRIYVPSLLFLTAGFLPSPDATHHVFSALAVLIALLLILSGIDSRRTAIWRVFAVGICCGLSFCFTPGRGILAVLAFCIFIYVFTAERGRSVSALIVGFLITTVILFGPIVWKAGVHNVIACLVDYPLHNYGASPWNNLAAYGTDLPLAGYALPTKQTLGSITGMLAVMRWLMIYLLCPWVYLLAAARLWKRAPQMDQSQRRRTVLVTIVGFALFLSIAYAPTHFRMGITSLPAFIVLLWLLESEKQIVRCSVIALAIFAASTLLAGIVRSQGSGFAILDTPSGKVALSPAVAASSTEKYRWLAEHTHPGDFLFTPDYVGYDYLFQLKHPGPTSSLWVNDYSTQEQVQQTVDALNREHVEYAIWPADFQNAASAPPDRLTPIREVLRDRYVLLHTFKDSDQVWKRKSD